MNKAESQLNVFHSAIEYAGESILITDKEGIIKYVNPTYTKTTGYSAKEAIGKNHKQLTNTCQNNGHSYYEDMWETITGGQIWEGKVKEIKKDGSFFPAILSMSPITNNKGEIDNFVGLYNDLSDIENIEHQFYQAQKMEALGTLVGGIAHDFNNILAGMTGNVYLAKKRSTELPLVLQNLDTVEQLTIRASALIKQLLTFARKDRVDMKPLPLNPFIKEVLKLLHSTIPENITVNQTFCVASLNVLGDPTLLHQVVMNLINNARDALEDVHEPCITINLEDFTVYPTFLLEHPYFKAKHYAHLSIQDNGKGIPKEDIAHLFEPFFTTKSADKGTGLGLAMAFGAVKTHDGYIEVESIEGSGTIFDMYIPTVSTKNIIARRSEEINTQGKGELILIVDDENEVLEMNNDVLESSGYQVLQARNGLEALERFSKYHDKISLVIIDVVMPKLGGVEAIRRIREINPNIKVIFTTGYDKESTLIDSSTLGSAIILSKPYNIESLHTTIREQLDL
ncbi:MAG: response regulator [Ghiorsea sp.]